MSDALERRRMRTWGDDPIPSERRRWMLVAKGQFMRCQHSWVFWSLVAAAILLALFTLIGSFVAMDESQQGIEGDAIAFGLLPAAAFLAVSAILLAAAPAIAEDIRFSAPLFYFSRPLHVRDYLIGKVAFTTGLLLLLVLPSIVVLGISSVGTWGAELDPPTRPGAGADTWEQEQYRREVERFEERRAGWNDIHMDSFGDWLATMSMLLVGVVASCVFLGAVTAYLSAVTARAWHAAMAVVVALGGLGLVGGALGAYVVGDKALALAFSPAAWPFAVTSLPLMAYYRTMDDPFLSSAAGTVVVCLILMAATTAVLYWRTYRRLERIGGTA